MPKPINVEWGLELSVLTSMLGAALLFVGISDALDWVVDLGGWGFYAGAGVISLIVGIVWMLSIIQRMRRFSVLIEEKSKAVFVRSLDDVEYTAWRLPSNMTIFLLGRRRIWELSRGGTHRFLWTIFLSVLVWPIDSLSLTAFFNSLLIYII
jgi:hypothetical protein